MLTREEKLLFTVILLIALILRAYRLDIYPPSLYSDEVSQGYNAYSILHTGHDEYGTNLPVSLRSFGDWKPPAGTYLMIPFIYFLGLNEWGLRLPSAILGSASVGLLFFLTKHILKRFTSWNEKFIKQISFFSMLTLCISPWHILQSRSAMLVVIALFFVILGLWSFFQGLLSEKKYWFLSGAAFTAAIYSYYGMRLIVPLLLLMLLAVFYRDIVKNTKLFSSIIGFCLLLLLPLGTAFIKEPNVLFGRAKTVSVFYDKGVSLTVGSQIAQDGITMNSRLAQFYHNKPYNYFIDIVRRFFEHLDGHFLFLIGDQNPPFQIPGMGVLYILDGVMLLVGSIYIFKNSTQISKFFFILIIISILPAALTYVTPASNRTLTLLVPFSLIIGVGLVKSIFHSRRRIMISTILSLVYIGCVSYFIYQYFLILPQYHADWWHFGYKELAMYVEQNQNKYDSVIISGRASMPYIFYLFYNHIDPSTVGTKIKRNFNLDEFGFEHVDQFDKLEFPRYFVWEDDQEKILPNSLLAVTGQEDVKTSDKVSEVKKIFLPDGRIAFKLYSIN